MKFIKTFTIITYLLTFSGCNYSNTVSKNNNIIEIKENKSISKEENKIIKVEITQKNITLDINKKSKLFALVKDENGEISSALEWISSDNTIVSVNNSGEINALKKGVAIVRALSLKDAKTYDECVVNVIDTESDKPTSINIENPSGLMEIYENSTLKLSAIVKYVNGNFDSNVNWKSSDSSIANINSSGLVTAIREGYVLLTATSTKNNAIYSTYKIRIKKNEFKQPDIINSFISENSNNNQFPKEQTLLINPSAIYMAESIASDKPFFSYSNNFNFAKGQEVLLVGEVHDYSFGRICCIATDESLIIKINDKSIEYKAGENYWEQPLNLTPWVIVGENTIKIEAFDHKGESYWLNQLKLTVR